MRFPLRGARAAMVNLSLLQHVESGLCERRPQWKPFVKVNGYPQAGNRPVVGNSSHRRIERVDDHARVVARIEHAVSGAPLPGKPRLDEGVGDPPCPKTAKFGR